MWSEQKEDAHLAIVREWLQNEFRSEWDDFARYRQRLSVPMGIPM